MSELLKAYAEAVESRSGTLAALTEEHKLAAAANVLVEVENYVRRYKAELKRIEKARRTAMPGFLRDIEESLSHD